MLKTDYEDIKTLLGYEKDIFIARNIENISFKKVDLFEENICFIEW
jgi:hypothetical protein